MLLASTVRLYKDRSEGLKARLGKDGRDLRNHKCF
jgi:hypothetical protein